MSPHQTKASAGKSLALIVGALALVGAIGTEIGSWRSPSQSATAGQARATPMPAPTQNQAAVAQPVGDSAATDPATDDTIQTRLTALEFWDALNAVSPGQHDISITEGGKRVRDARPALPAVRPMARSATEGGDRRVVRTSSAASTYRTVCVRVCDGFFWPVSFAATPKDFARDQQTCSASCDSEVRLFSYRNGGSSREDPFAVMQDANGAPYTSLKSAYQFRNTYNEACKCKPHPWEAASQDRHKVPSTAPAEPSTNTPASSAGWADLRAKIASAQSAARGEPVAPSEPAKASPPANVPRKADRPSKSASSRAASSIAAAKPAPRRAASGNGGVVMLYLGARPPITVRIEPAS